MAGSSNLDSEIACQSCDAFTNFETVTAEYANGLSGLLQPGMLLIMSASVGILLIYRGIQISMSQIPPQQIMMDLFYILLAYMILTGAGGAVGLINMLYQAGLTTMSNASALAFSISLSDPVEYGGRSGFNSLLLATELAFFEIFDIAGKLWDRGGVYSPTPLIMGFVLVAPWVAMLIAFLAQLAIALFRLTLLAVLSPFLAMSFAFGWSRQMTSAGIRTFIGVIITLFSATAALGLSVFFIQKVSTELNYNELQFFDFAFLSMVFMGIIGAALMTEGVGLANSITGTMLSNTAAGIASSGGLAVVGAGKAHGMRAGKGVGGAVGKKGMAAGFAGIGYAMGASGASGGIDMAKEKIKQQFYNSKVGGAVQKMGGIAQTMANNPLHQRGKQGAQKGTEAFKKASDITKKGAGLLTNRKD